jgi:hypothetical protein
MFFKKLSGNLNIENFFTNKGLHSSECLVIIHEALKTRFIKLRVARSVLKAEDHNIFQIAVSERMMFHVSVIDIS